jgi:hypothetical protein
VLAIRVKLEENELEKTSATSDDRKASLLIFDGSLLTHLF